MTVSLLQLVLEEGVRAWSDIEIDPEQVRAYLEPRQTCLGNLTSTRAADLFLACACLCGNAKALRHLDALSRVQLRCAAQRLHSTVDEEEMIATLMARLLVAEPGRNPRLSQYAGRSELRRWLQVAATRHILYAKRRPARSAPLEETMLAEVLAAAVPEWGNADVASRQAFKEALGRALKSLGKRDRSLLRLRLEGLNTIAIGKIFRVDRRQVSRWLGRVNVAIEQEVRRELRESMRLTSQDLDSLVRSVLSRVDTSIRFQVSSAIQDDK